MWLAVLFYVGLGAIILWAVFGNHSTDKLAPEEQKRALSKNATLAVAGGLLGLVAVIGLSWWGGQRHGNEWFPKQSPLPAAQVKQAVEQQHWITIKSGVRHNSGCRYFQNSRGRLCGPADGRACKICGG